MNLISKSEGLWTGTQVSSNRHTHCFLSARLFLGCGSNTTQSTSKLPEALHSPAYGHVQSRDIVITP